MAHGSVLRIVIDNFYVRTLRLVRNVIVSTLVMTRLGRHDYIGQIRKQFENVYV